MDKQQIIDYVMNSPANTNPNVLGTMLDGIGGQESSIDFGAMDFTRPGLRYIVLDFDEATRSYTVNTSPTPFEMVDIWGYKRLNTIEELETAIEGLYNENNGQYTAKHPYSEVGIVSKTPDIEQVVMSLNNNHNNILRFDDGLLDTGYVIYLHPDNSWELAFEGISKFVVVHSGTSNEMFEDDSDVKTTEELINIAINENRPDLLTVTYRDGTNDIELTYDESSDNESKSWSGISGSRNYILVVNANSVRAEDLPD